MADPGLHHFERRRRYARLEPYPHPDRLKNIVDRMVYVAVFAGPVLTLPQVAKIWMEKSASGISAFTWASYILMSLFWLAYGALHRERPIIISSIIWVALEALMVGGALLYG